MAFMAMSMVMMAQHVTPLNIQIAEVKLDSLRTLYQTEPTMYRASLDVVAQQLARNNEELKQAEAELKSEQAHAKEMENAIKEATKMSASLKKLYAKELQPVARAAAERTGLRTARDSRAYTRHLRPRVRAAE